MDLDSYLGIHQRALTIASQRTDVLAQNLANTDTPGYKARDIDFKAVLNSTARPAANAAGGTTLSTAGAPLPLASTSAGRNVGTTVATAADTPELKYRTPLAPALDGNTVDSNLEQAAFAENAVRYQASLTFINSKLRSLMTAITGQ